MTQQTLCIDSFIYLHLVQTDFVLTPETSVTNPPFDLEFWFLKPKKEHHGTILIFDDKKS